jgi:hypothetical protein
LIAGRKTNLESNMDQLHRVISYETRSTARLSRHAAARIRQRGLTESDVELIRKTGESVEDGYVMSNRAVEQRLHELQREINRIERLRGVALIEGESQVITVYRADSARIRKLFAKH